MDKLSDSKLLIIFNLVNLNERSILRGVSRKFKCLIDSIAIEKLVVFENATPIPCRFKDGDYYGSNEIVRVNSLNQFFNTKSVLKSIRNIKKLKIIGTKPDCSIDLKVHFRKLTYFEAQNMNFITPIILISPNINTLILSNACMNRDELYNIPHFTPLFVVFYGFMKLKCNIKHLSLVNISFLTNIISLKYRVNNGLFKAIECID